MPATIVKLKSETGGVHKFDVDKITEPIAHQIANDELVPVSAADTKKLVKAEIITDPAAANDTVVDEQDEEPAVDEQDEES